MEKKVKAFNITALEIFKRLEDEEWHLKIDDQEYIFTRNKSWLPQEGLQLYRKVVKFSTFSNDIEKICKDLYENIEKIINNELTYKNIKYKYVNDYNLVYYSFLEPIELILLLEDKEIKDYKFFIK